MVWVVFMKATFWCLNIKPDNGFLAYRMPEIFYKTGQGLTDIIVPWAGFKGVLQLVHMSPVY